MIIFSILAAIGEASSNKNEELDLMRRIKAKEADALSQLYDTYNRLLFGMILSIVKSKPEAEDILQEVFIKIWQKADSFREGRGNVFSWIVTLTRNLAIDRIRSKGYKTQQKASGNVDDPAIILEGDHYDPLETTIFSERAEIVKKALHEIPEKQSKVLEIAYYRGMTQSEISDNFDIPLGTVKTRMRQGMLKLKDILEAHIQKDD